MVKFLIQNIKKRNKIHPLSMGMIEAKIKREGRDIPPLTSNHKYISNKNNKLKLNINLFFQQSIGIKKCKINVNINSNRKIHKRASRI